MSQLALDLSGSSAVISEAIATPEGVKCRNKRCKASGVYQLAVPGGGVQWRCECGWFAGWAESPKGKTTKSSKV